MSASDELGDGAPRRDAALSALDELIRAAHQWALYGAAHPVTRQACAAAAAAFIAVMAEREHFTITVVESRLLADGEELPPTPPLRQLHQTLRSHQIATLTIQSQVTPDEIAALIGVLGTDAATLARDGGAGAALQAAGAEQIELVEVDYSRFVPSAQAQWLSAFAGAQISIHRTVEDLVGTCVELAGDRLQVAVAPAAAERGLPMPFPIPVPAETPDDHLGEASLRAEIAALSEVAPDDYVAVGLAWLIQGSGEALAEAPPQMRAQWREAIARRLSQLDLSLQARILRAPRQVGSRGPDVLAGLVADRSPEELADLIVARPAAVVGEPSASLERILRRTLTDERKLLSTEPLLRQRLMDRGMSQDSYRNVVGLLLDQLAADLALRVSGPEQWMGMLSSESFVAGGTLWDWPDLLGTIAPALVAQSRLRVLLTALPLKHHTPHYLDIVSLLEQCAGERYAAQDLTAVLQIVRALATEAGRDDATRAAIAAAALQRLAEAEAPAALRQALATAADDERRGLLEIAAKIGHACAEVLAEEAERPAHPELQAYAVRLLADGGERGAATVRQLLAQAPLDRVMDITAALIEGRDERFLEHLVAALGHRQVAVRMALADQLKRVPGLAGEQLLIRALYDPEPAVQAQAAHSLGETQARGAIHALAVMAIKGPLHGRRFDVRRAAVQALGRIGSPEAVPTLAELAAKRSLLFREHADDLARLAIAALKLIPGPEARAALTAGADRSPAAPQPAASGAPND